MKFCSNDHPYFSIPNPEARIFAVQDILARLPRSNYANLRYLIKFLSKLLENQAYTKMSSQNLAIVMAPNMIWNPSEGDGYVPDFTILEKKITFLVLDSV